MFHDSIATFGRAMRHRNYRLFFTGQSISLTGTWMERTALIWLVYRMTNSVAMMGLVDFVGQIPTFLVTPFAGVMLDRWQRYRVILICQLLTMLQSLTFAFLILTERIEVWHIFTLGFFLGAINAFDIPARQSFVIDVVDDREDLGNAIALNSSLFNAARIFGPSVAGSVIAAIGEGLCFLVNGIAHGATVFALVAMDLKPRPCSIASGNILREMSDGVQYAWKAAPLRSVLLLLAATSFSGWPVLMMLPVFAGNILAGGPQTLGLLLTVFGCGAIVATAYLASRKQVRGIERVIVGGGLIFGVGLMVFSQSTWLWLSLLAIFFSGFGMIAQVASINTVLQTLVDEDKRGRLMSLYVMSFSGSVPLGSLIAGQIAEVIGTPYTLLAGAILCVASSLAFYQYLATWQAATERMHAAREITV